MYLTIFYLVLLAVFVSALSGFMFYRVSDKKFTLSTTLSYLFGGIVSLLLGGVWFYHVPIAVLAIVLYVAFLLNSKGQWKFIMWLGIVVLTVIIAGHVYLMIGTL